ncbi:MAG: hypothetical protein LW690_01535 [Opitutaceae bacterium]|jgi:hypothetical protein|nr:hypothetical protein [Opitutaceae bacterium]
MIARPLLLAVALLAAARAPAAGAEFVRIWPAWQEASAFDRIGEYFGTAEPGAGTTVLRTSPGTREGYYFLSRVRTVSPANGARFELQVIRPDAPTPVTFQFRANVPAGETAFQLGLTGTAWPGGSRANPVAWKISFFDGNGRLLAEHKSFLWEKPAP